MDLIRSLDRKLFSFESHLPGCGTVGVISTGTCDMPLGNVPEFLFSFQTAVLSLFLLKITGIYWLDCTFSSAFALAREGSRHIAPDYKWFLQNFVL